MTAPDPRMSGPQEVWRVFSLVSRTHSGWGSQRGGQRAPSRSDAIGGMLVVDGRCVNTPRPVRTPDETRSRT
jgi:hypothetical protein